VLSRMLRHRKPPLTASLGIVFGSALIIGLTAATAPAPATPSSQLLSQLGIVATPLSQVEPVSESQALTAVDSWFAGPPSGPVTYKLVMFSQSGTPALLTPQPAWILTWNDPTQPYGLVPLNPGQYAPTVTTWPYMNAVVSAVTGKVLLEFPDS